MTAKCESSNLAQNQSAQGAGLEVESLALFQSEGFCTRIKTFSSPFLANDRVQNPPDSYSDLLAQNPIRAFVDLGECVKPFSFSNLNQYKNADLGGFEPLRSRCVTKRVKRVLLALAQNTREQQGHQWYRFCSVCARRRPCVSQQGRTSQDHLFSFQSVLNIEKRTSSA